MATEKVDFSYVVNGNAITITPVDPAKVVDNSSYTISIENVKSIDGDILPNVDAKIRTPFSPMYCSVDSVRALVDTFGISEQSMMSYIRDASKYADFVAGGTAVKKGQTPSFAVEQFVRTKAMLDCLVRGYMERSSTTGGNYKLDTIEIQDASNSTSFKNLINLLRDLLKQWQDAIRGYYNEGRVKPKATRVGLKSSTNSDVAHTTVDQILNDISR